MASLDYQYSDTVQPFKLAYAKRLAATKSSEVLLRVRRVDRTMNNLTKGLKNHQQHNCTVRPRGIQTVINFAAFYGVDTCGTGSCDWS